MCEANAYLIKAGEEKLIMESLDQVVPEDEGIRLISIFGDQKFISARIHSLSLLDNKVFFKEEDPAANAA